MKVAQYEVLGNNAKRGVRPARGTIEVFWLLVLWYAPSRAQATIDRPVRDVSL
jgi:hypothetical protein